MSKHTSDPTPESESRPPSTGHSVPNTTGNQGSQPRTEQERITGQSKADLAAEAAPGDRVPGEDLKARQDQLLDEAIEETFPASDPISPKRIT